MKNLILLTTILGRVITLALQRMMRATLILLPMFMISAQVFAQEKLEVEGAIIIGDSEDSSPVPGTIRWTGLNFEGWNGFVWVPLSSFQIAQIISDIDGNQYRTVQIGNQEWMAENLRTSRYNDGVFITKVIGDMDWETTSSGAWIWYQNNFNYEIPFGKLYNWFAVNTGKLCPVGWHVPSDTEWDVLYNFLNSTGSGGGKMKATGTSQSGNGHWLEPNTGATNESGFTGLPGGERDESGTYDFTGARGSWWTTTEWTVTTAFYIYLQFNSSLLVGNIADKNRGLSIRCIKD